MTLYYHYCQWGIGIDFEVMMTGWSFKKQRSIYSGYRFGIMFGPYTLGWEYWK